MRPSETTEIIKEELGKAYTIWKNTKEKLGRIVEMRRDLEAANDLTK